MTVMRDRRLRVLLSEGASTSAREAVTALGLAGHHVEIVDPSRHGLARFSRFVRRTHRCPPLATDPEGYRDFVLHLVAGGRFDVLLPIHEQGYLLSRIADRLARHVAVALPAFHSYDRAITRSGFGGLLAELGIAQPRTVPVTAPNVLRETPVPFVLKAETGTASRAVWIVLNRDDLARAIGEIESAGAFGTGLILQELIEGPVEHAQTIFRHGSLVAMHAYRQTARGAGGGPALKESIAPADVREDLSRIGAVLAWHGALSVDYIRRATDGVAVYIDSNPRLVEPMSGWLAGIDLTDLLLRVSMGEEEPEQPPARTGVRTHLAMQVMMGMGLRGDGRAAVLRQGWQAVTARGAFSGSREELTPVGLDWPSILPLLGTAMALAVSPGSASSLAKRGWGGQLLTPEAMRRIRSWPEPDEDGTAPP